MKKKTTLFTLVLFTFVSLLGNVVFVFLYYFKYAPYLDKVESNSVENNLKLDEINNLISSSNCRKYYSESKNKVILSCPTYVGTRSDALAECSKNSLSSEMLKAFTTFNELEKGREFLMKMCMQKYGFDY